MPLNEFAPERVSVPALSVMPPVVVAMAQLRVSAPAPALVSENVFPPIAPPKESVFAETVIVRLPASVMAPVVWVRFAVPRKVKSDDSVRTLLMLTALAASRLPPLRVTVVPLPKAFAAPAESVPAESVVLPKALLAPESVSLPAPSLVRPPVPVTVLLRTTSEAVVSERVETPVATVPLRVNAPVATASPKVADVLRVKLFASVNGLVPLVESVVPEAIATTLPPRAVALPTWTEPTFRLKPPEKELALPRTSVPAPVFVMPTVPATAEVIVAVIPVPTERVGEVPLNVSVFPPIVVLLVPKVMPLSVMPVVSVTFIGEPRLKTAALPAPLTKFPDQLLVAVSQFEFVDPVQV